MRNELSRYWARFDCFLNIQPLDQIMQYFGATTAIYFAWVWVFRIFYSFFYLKPKYWFVYQNIGSLALMLFFVKNKFDQVRTLEDWILHPNAHSTCYFWHDGVFSGSLGMGIPGSH